MGPAELAVLFRVWQVLAAMVVRAGLVVLLMAPMEQALELLVAMQVLVAMVPTVALVVRVALQAVLESLVMAVVVGTVAVPPSEAMVAMVPRVMRRLPTVVMAETVALLAQLPVLAVLEAQRVEQGVVPVHPVLAAR